MGARPPWRSTGTLGPALRCAARRNGWAASDDFDVDVVGVSRECFDVGSVAGEDGAARLGDRDDECIDGRVGVGEAAELGCSAGDVTLAVGSMMHVFKKRWVLASRPASPCNDSTSTIVDTSGGHSSCAVRARMSETEVFVRAARRESPPLSRRSTLS